MHFYTFRPHTPTVRKNGHRRCRAVVEPTSHGLRRGRGCAARHRFAISTSGDHRVAAAEGASRGENRPFGLSRANEWLPMPTAVSPIGNMRSRAVWTYRSASRVSAGAARSGAALAGTACESALGPLGPRSPAARTAGSDLWRSRDRRKAIDPDVMHAWYMHTCLFRQFRLSFNRTPDCLLFRRRRASAMLKSNISLQRESDAASDAIEEEATIERAGVWIAKRSELWSGVF